MYQPILDKIKLFLVKVSDPADKTSIILFTFSKIVRALTFLVKNIFEITYSILRVIPWVSLSFMVFNSAVKIINTLTSTSDTNPVRGVKLVAAIIRFGLSIAALVALGLVLLEAGLPIMIALVATEVLQNIFLISISVYDRHFGVWKHERDELLHLKEELHNTYENYTCTNNKSNANVEQKIILIQNRITVIENSDREKRADIAEKVNGSVLAVITFCSVIMLLTPAALFGAGILIGISLYSAADKFNINPLRYLANKLFGYPFQLKKPLTSFAEVKSDLAVKYHGANVKSGNAISVDSSSGTMKKVFQTIGKPEAVQVTNDHVQASIPVCQPVLSLQQSFAKSENNNSEFVRDTEVKEINTSQGGLALAGM